MSAADLDAWIHDRPPHRGPLNSLTDRSDLRTVKLFSLNDYLGLSTHPAVRAATADAACACGSGERVPRGFYHDFERALQRLDWGRTRKCLSAHP
jgi:7-keto-8-aminopelargonate synthetase-like enzyme